MNTFDIAVVVVVGGLGLLGLFKGLVRLVLGLASIVVATLAAGRYHAAVAEQGLERLVGEPGTAALLAYVVVWVAVVLGFGVVVWLVRGVLERAAPLRWADRLAGAAVGVAAGVLLLSSFAIPAVAWLPGESTVLRESRFAPYVLRAAALLEAALPEELGRRYEEERRELEEAWRRRDRGA